MSTNIPEKMLQFAPLQSFISPTFWHKLAENKLNFDRLSDAPKPIYGYYTNHNAKSCLLEVDYSAYNNDFKPPKFCHTAIGTIYNKNTIEEFKQCDKNALIASEGQKLIDDFQTDAILDNPNLLARFFVLSFADLKCHSYYYWFGFPCPLTPTQNLVKESSKLKDIPALKHLYAYLDELNAEQKNFFAIDATNENKLEYLTLKQCVKKIQMEDLNLVNIYFCFADASEYAYPAWFMRIYTAFIYHKCPQLLGKSLKFLGLRYNNQMAMDDSVVWEIIQNESCILDEVKFVGWEPNRNNKMGPRLVSMEDTMDPKKLAENSVNLNLKLMKWRLVPDLDLDIMAQTKCLLFGAGTLGCAVARNLLSWGFKHVSLIDNGKVGFSNPIRQSLYTYADAVASNVPKATTAAQRLQEINPNTTTAGYVMQIPMPGHTVGESLQEQTTEDLNKIKDLIQQHDVLFLLTDSRESRWLPTMMGAAYNKIVINAALGFDSYLVMRHGANNQSVESMEASKTLDIDELKCIQGNNLGCYFCNDVTAPGNSLKDRTLDQQCTVTRPGVSNIAASYAVELLVSILQHPQRHEAPAYYSHTTNTNAKIPEGLLGILPHSIRGMLFNYENILPATQKFTQCIACSKRIISEYRDNGNDFLFKAFETAKYLEDLTGISEFKELSNEIIDFDDSDLELSDE